MAGTVLAVTLGGATAASRAPAGKNRAEAQQSRQSFEYRFGDVTPPSPASQRRLAEWYQDAKYGAFIHFGVYSMLAGEYQGRGADHRYSEWIRFAARIPPAEYHALAATFNPAQFDAEEWARLFQRCGLRYVVITAKHHDGFALFKSAVSPFNLVDATPFKRDLIAELSQACHRHGLKFGVYYSQAQDWDEPDAPFLNNRAKLADLNPNLPKNFVPDMDRYLRQKALPQVEELVKNYELDLIWFDTPAGMTPARAQQFHDLVRKYRPHCLINSRLIHSGKAKIEPESQHLYDYVSIGDKEVPTVPLPIYYESPDSVSTSYAYKTKGEVSYHSVTEMIHRLVDTVCFNGNYLLNSGPMGNGQLDPKAVATYEAIGAWLQQNGESIYGTTPNPLGVKPAFGNISRDKSGRTLYLHVFDWPASGKLQLDAVPGTVRAAAFLAHGSTVSFRQEGKVLHLDLPPPRVDPYDAVIRLTLAP